MSADHPGAHGGLRYALATYLIWGILPLYLRLLKDVPPFEFVAWRIVWTVPICLLIVLVRRQGTAVMAALCNPRTAGLLVVSAVLIATNWLTYIFAIQRGHVLATSLGYYINPLANVLAGTLFLGERLSRLQWGAVLLAACGVALLAFEANDMLFISLTLAVSFAAYGLVRKLVPVESLPGLTIETLVLAPPAAFALFWIASGPAGSSFGHDIKTSLLIVGTGVATAVPLLLFAIAARRMSYSALGMVQFLAPTIVFVLGIFVFEEPLRKVQAVCFVIIWSAIALFSWDMLSRYRSQRAGKA